MASLIKKLALGLAALFTSLGFCELVTRIFVPVRNVGPSFTTYDSIYGQKLKPSFSATRITPEFTMRFTTNSLGFRGTEAASVPHLPILFMGDSFTMGYGVSDGEEFPSLVREALSEDHRGRAIPVVNTGMGHNGNGRWVKFLRINGERYNPRLVVFQLHANDFANNVREGFFTLTSSGELLEQAIPDPGVRRRLQRLAEAIPGLPYSYLVSLVRQVHWKRSARREVESGDSNALEMSFADRLTLTLLAEVLKIKSAQDWPAIALFVDIKGKRLADLEGLFSAHGVPTVRAPSKDERPDLYYEVDGHWNVSGHAVAAELILEQMVMLGIGNSKNR